MRIEFDIRFKVFCLILSVYLIAFAIIFVDFSKILKVLIFSFYLDFYNFFPKFQNEIILTSLIHSFFLLVIPFFCYLIIYVKFFFSTNYFISHLFFPHKLKRYLKKAEELVFDEENMDIDIDLSGNFYHADLMIYNHPLIFLTLLPGIFLLMLHSLSLDWDNIDMDAEEDAVIERQEENYGSLQTSLFDEYYARNPLRELKPFYYYRTERLLPEIEDESLESAMEDINEEEEDEQLDFLIVMSDFFANLVCKKISNLFPKPILNFLKFENTELALKNLFIFILYFPFLFYVSFKKIRFFILDFFIKK